MVLIGRRGCCWFECVWSWRAWHIASCVMLLGKTTSWRQVWESVYTKSLDTYRWKRHIGILSVRLFFRLSWLAYSIVRLWCWDCVDLWVCSSIWCDNWQIRVVPQWNIGWWICDIDMSLVLCPWRYGSCYRRVIVNIVSIMIIVTITITARREIEPTSYCNFFAFD